MNDKALEVRANELEKMKEKADRLARQLRECRNELCYQCGRYRNAHNGACNSCKYRAGGEWEEDIAWRTKGVAICG